jgi:hypothetical protein
LQTLSVATSLRPARIAVLCDIGDPYWSRTCRHILELFSSLWGGHGSIIVPTDGRVIDPLFWKILDVYDPDYLCEYRITGRDLDERDPGAFAQWLANRMKDWNQDSDALSAQEIARIRQTLSKEDMSAVPISSQLRQELKTRLAPFFFEQFIVQAAAWRSGDIPGFPYTNICDIIRESEVPQQIIMPSGLSSPTEFLWYSAALGTCNQETLEKLQTFGRWPRPLGDGSSTGDAVGEQKKLISFAVDRASRERRSSLDVTSQGSGVSESLSLTATDLSLMNLGWYRQSRSRDWAPKALAVAGDTLSDFCLYLALSRMRERVFWVFPPISDDASNGGGTAFGRGPSYTFANALRITCEYTSQYSPGLDLVSATLNSQQLTSILTSLAAAGQFQMNADLIGDPQMALPDLPLRYFESSNASKQRIVQVPDSGIIELFETPKPVTIENLNASVHRWITDVEIRGHQPPRHPELGSWLIGGGNRSTSEVRISSVGSSYFCPNSLIFTGQDIDAAVFRPNIRVPSAREIFNKLVDIAGATCTISDKGFYAQEAVEKLGGLEDAAQFLKSAPGLALVDAFLSEAPNKPGKYDQGVFLESRRYLNSTALVKVLGGIERAAKYIDSFSQRGILYKGFILQCEFCRYAAWMPIKDLTDRFTCLRCHRDQVYTSKHWKLPRSQPSVYYQLDEIVYQGLVNDMIVPILTLDFLRRGAAGSFQYTEELEYRMPNAPKPFIECDVSCIVDGVIMIGEAKTADRLDATRKKELRIIQDYRQLASMIGARRLVFGTRADKWDPTTVQSTRAALAKDPVELLFLSKNQLFS